MRRHPATTEYDSSYDFFIIWGVLAALVLGVVDLLVKKGIVPREKQTEYIGWSAVATGVIAAAIKLAFG